MKRLIAIELQKIWKNKASRILTLTYFILLTFIALIASIKFDIGPIEIKAVEQGVFNFPYIWHFNAYIGVYGKLFFAIVIVSMVANEYSYGTLKQNLIDGMSKKEFLLSKFYTILLFSIISTLFIFIISIILGLLFSSYNEIGIIFSRMEYLIAYFLNILGFFTFCLFVGLLIKRSAFALGFIILWFLFEVFLIHSNINFPDFLKQFLPLQAISDLIVEPFTKLGAIKTVKSQLSMDQFKDYTLHWQTILIVVSWIIILMISSYNLLKKRDL